MIETALSCDGWPETVDWEAVAAVAIAAALAATPYGELARIEATVEVSVRLTNDAEVQTLNRDYRQKDMPTNVLSFPMVPPDLIEGLANTDDGEVLLGDIVLAYETCAREATERGIALGPHASHLIVHGMLHLLGYDHKRDGEAAAMESLEQGIMAKLGLHDPYRLDHLPN